MRKIRVTALTAGKYDPSRRFRVCQLIAPLAQREIEVAEYHPIFSKYMAAPVPQLGFVWTAGKIMARVPGVNAARACDVTLLQRELIPGRRTFESLAGRRRLFDVDDAVWMGQHDSGVERIVNDCRGVIAGNEFLADYFRKRGARVWVVPTSVDAEVWKPAPKRECAEWVVGWIGTASNLKYLYDVEKPLSEFLNEHADARLLVVCDKEPHFKSIPDRCWRFERWSADTEVSQVQQMDVGLMPLSATDWERGKCGCKMLTYMAVSIPTIATPVGVAADILRQDEVGLSADDDDWYTALCQLHSDRALASRLGSAGRKLLEARYSIERSAESLANIFREVAAEA